MRNGSQNNQDKGKEGAKEIDKKHSGFLSYLKGVGAFGFLVAILMAGFGISSGTWSSTLANMQIDLRRTQDQLGSVREELSQVKSEYAAYREKYCASPGGGDISIPLGSSSSTQQTHKPEQAVKPASEQSTLSNPPNSDTDKLPSSESILLQKGRTEAVFGGQVIISLIAIHFEGDPLRHMVTATIGAAGYPNINITKQDVGYTVVFQGSATYEIRIASADTFDAGFLVTKLQP